MGSAGGQDLAELIQRLPPGAHNELDHTVGAVGAGRVP